ncbi:ABC transporter substrate-binding protein [Comamonadaceae bacterium OH2545_COT-014]|nr:ABC transporter substrate-binding protein [Comamonadaceae bacterium OH2545_COT-014]
MRRRHFIQTTGATLAASTFTPALLRSAQAAEAGLSASSIQLKTSLCMTGPLTGIGTGTAAGMQAVVKAVNTAGGVHGRKIELQVLDDGYELPRAVENVKKILADGNVFALLSCTGTPHNAAVLPLISQAGVPYLAPYTGADQLRTADFPGVFHIRASYASEVARLMQQITQMGFQRIGIIHTDNDFGRGLAKQAMQALSAASRQAVANLPMAVDGQNADAVAQQMITANPAVVFMATAGSSIIPAIQALKRQRQALPVMTTSVGLPADAAQHLKGDMAGIAVTRVMPDPFKAKTPVVRDFHAAMQAAGTRHLVNASSMEGYINMRLMVEALNRAGRDLSRDRLRTALAGIKGFDLGGFTVSYDSGKEPYVGSRYVELGITRADGSLLG